MIDFLDSLPVKIRAKVFASITKLIELKNCSILPPKKLSKHIEDSIFELRVKFKNNILRCLYFYEINQEIIFTHGFIKKTQKLPKEELNRAKELRTKHRRITK